MSLIASDNGPSPNHFYWNASGGGGGGGGVSGLLGSVSGSVATNVAIPKITGAGGIACTTTTSGLVISNSGSGGSVPTLVSVTGSAYFTQQTFIPTTGNAGSIHLVLAGGGANVNGDLNIPSDIITGLSNSAYTTLRIDGTLPIYERQSGEAGSTGNYYQTQLVAAGSDVSGRPSAPATQFHPIISASGSGLTGTSGLLLGGSTFSYPFSLVLSKTNVNITASSSTITFKLTSTSSSNAAFYIGGSVASQSNAVPMVFTLSP